MIVKIIGLKSCLLIFALNIFLLGCGGGTKTTSVSNPAPPSPSVQSTWGSTTILGNLPNSGTRFIQFANPESKTTALTWGEYGGFLMGLNPGFAELQNGVWTKSAFPFSGSPMDNLQAIGDEDGNLTLIGVRSGAIQTSTRRGGSWTQISTVATSPSFGSHDINDNFPLVSLFGKTGVLVGYRTPYLSSASKYDIYISRRVSESWIEDHLDSDVDGGFRIKGNSDGTAFASWYKGNQIYCSRFRNNAWEQAKPINIPSDGISSLSFYNYLLLSTNGNIAYFVTTTQAEGALHISEYDGSQILTTTFPQNQRTDIIFTADISDDGALIVGWSPTYPRAVYSRILYNRQWGPQFSDSGTIACVNIINKDHALVFAGKDSPGVNAIDWLSGAWQPKKEFYPYSSFSALTLGRAPQKQWVVAWGVVGTSSSSNTETLVVTTGKPPQ